MTDEEHEAVKRLQNTTHVSNTHVSPLMYPDSCICPFLRKDSNLTLPNSRFLAVSRFLSLENRLNKKPELKKCYKDTDTIHDYINKGQATKL